MKLRYFSFVFIAFVSCKKEESLSLPFEWVENGNAITYNYTSATEFVESALILNVERNDLTGQFLMNFSYPKWDGIPSNKNVGEDYKVVRKSDGLNGQATQSCVYGGMIPSFFNFLRVPLHPQLNDTLTTYLCTDVVSNYIIVMEIDKEVSVPLGTFSTLVLQDFIGRRKEYWHEKNGLILIEKLDETGMVTGRYEAVSRNF